MADVQIENGFTKIANEILEQLSKRKLNGAQTSILFTVFRFTYGFNRKSHELSLTFIENHTGIKKKRLSPELKSLIDNRVLTVFSESSYDHKSREIGFNKNYDEWQLEFWNSPQISEQSPNLGTVPKNEDRTVPKNGNRSVPKFGNQEIKDKENLKENIYTPSQEVKKSPKASNGKRVKKNEYAEFVHMTEEEFQKLVERFGESGANDRIEALNLYKGSTGKKYQSDYMTILKWERDENKKQQPKQTKNNSNVLSESELPF